MLHRVNGLKLFLVAVHRQVTLDETNLSSFHRFVRGKHYRMFRCYFSQLKLVSTLRIIICEYFSPPPYNNFIEFTADIFRDAFSVLGEWCFPKV